MLPHFIAFCFFQGLAVSGPRSSEVLGIYATLPARGKKHPIKVKVVPLEDWKNGLGIIGVYWITQARSEVRADLEKYEFVSTVGHEYGHHVYFTAFSVPEIQAWNDFWRANKESMPSEYGKTSPSEGWAESYSARFTGVNPETNTYGVKLSANVKHQIDSLIWPSTTSSLLTLIDRHAKTWTATAKPTAVPGLRLLTRSR